MAEDRKIGGGAPPSEEEPVRLQALADKRNAALDAVSDADHKQQESHRSIVDKMR